MTQEEEQKAWIAEWSRQIATAGLSPIAAPLLDVAQAFGFLGSQMLLLIQPLASESALSSTLERITLLLDDPELLNLLQTHLAEDRRKKGER
jgi:hypothetical protein